MVKGTIVALVISISLFVIFSGVALAAADGEKADATRLYNKIVNLSRSLDTKVNYKQLVHFRREIKAEMTRYAKLYPHSIYKQQADKIVACYADAEILWAQAAYSDGDGDDAVYKNSAAYKNMEQRYPGIFERLEEKGLCEKHMNNTLYWKVDIAGQVIGWYGKQGQQEFKCLLQRQE